MSSTIENSWTRISSWLDTNAPDALENALPAATDENIDEAATNMNVTLHRDHVNFCKLVNGAESSGIFPAHEEWEDMAFSPMSLEDSVSAWVIQKELLEMGEFSDLTPNSNEGIADNWWNTSWIPFADNGGGDYYCVDLAPAKGGTNGQLIFHSHESGDHVVLADSLAQYLSDLADKLEAGELEYDEDYGIMPPDIDE